MQINFISDVHHAQEASDEDLLIEDLKDQSKHTLFMGVGDELDSISPDDKKRHRLENLKDKFCDKKVYPRLIEEEVEDYARIIMKHTKPHQWLGHITGNHPYKMTQFGVDPVRYLCSITKHSYLSYSAYVPVNINYGGKILSIMILAHHGFGGTNARKEGSGLNSYIDHALRYEGWDLACYGHRHDRWVKTVPRIKPQLGGIKEKPAWVRAVDRKVIQCGTYLRTLSHSEYPTYSERAGYPPRPLGCIKIKIGIDRLRDNGRDNMSIRWLGSNE